MVTNATPAVVLSTPPSSVTIETSANMGVASAVPTHTLAGAHGSQGPTFSQTNITPVSTPAHAFFSDANK